MVWTEHQACVQALERGRAALTKTSEDMARVIEALTPGVGEAALGNLHQVFTATAIADRVLASYMLRVFEDALRGAGYSCPVEGLIIEKETP